MTLLGATRAPAASHGNRWFVEGAPVQDRTSGERFGAGLSLNQVESILSADGSGLD